MIDEVMKMLWNVPADISRVTLYSSLLLFLMHGY